MFLCKYFKYKFYVIPRDFYSFIVFLFLLLKENKKTHAHLSATDINQYDSHHYFQKYDNILQDRWNFLPPFFHHFKSLWKISNHLLNAVASSSNAPFPATF